MELKFFEITVLSKIYYHSQYSVIIFEAGVKLEDIKKAVLKFIQAKIIQHYRPIKYNVNFIACRCLVQSEILI